MLRYNHESIARKYLNRYQREFIITVIVITKFYYTAFLMLHFFTLLIRLNNSPFCFQI